MSNSKDLLLDASALMAFFRQEEGYDVVKQALLNRNCLVCTVQIVEVKGKLAGEGHFTLAQVEAELFKFSHMLTILPFDDAAQQAASFYYARRKPYNLSLGDAVCLGLAEALGADVLTAERGWAQLADLPITVQLIR